jgi:hypothetical protein
MYGKAFASMYTGSMYGCGMHVFAVWNFVLANSDAKGYLEINPRLLAATLGGPATEVQAAIDYLSSADENSRNPDEEGRRIVREGQFLYRIVSHKKYRDMRDSEGKKEYDRNYRREERARGKSSLSSEDVVKNTNVVDESLKSSQVEVEVEVINTKASPTKSDDGDVPPLKPPRSAKVPSENSPDVDAIYRAYPKRVAPRAAKKAIVAALKRLAPEKTGDWLLGRVQRYAQTCQGKDKQFIPFPATWFNGGQYDDEDDKPAQKPTFLDGMVFANEGAR